MTLATYDILAKAIQEKSLVTCSYQGHVREVCPHALGYKDGREKVLAFQWAGGSSKGLSPAGEWRCMFVDELTGVGSKAGPWRTADNHSRKQSCIDEVTYEVAF